MLTTISPSKSLSIFISIQEAQFCQFPYYQSFPEFQFISDSVCLSASIPSAVPLSVFFAFICAINVDTSTSSSPLSSIRTLISAHVASPRSGQFTHRPALDFLPDCCHQCGSFICAINVSSPSFPSHPISPCGMCPQVFLGPHPSNSLKLPS